MSRLRKPRVGEVVRVKERPLEFSFWPMFKGTRRYGLQAHVYATNPWAVIRAAIKERCPSGAKPEALASIDQAQYFYQTALDAESWAAKPLLLYYSFMNVAKAYALTRQIRMTFDKAHHGLSERMQPNGRELVDGYLRAFVSKQGSNPNLFADFLHAVSGAPLPTDRDFPLITLLPQIVVGHRLWCNAADRPERFISIENIEFREDNSSRRLWLNLGVFADDLSRLDLSRADLMRQARLSGVFRQVESRVVKGREVVQLEQTVPTVYSHRPADKIMDVVMRCDTRCGQPFGAALRTGDTTYTSHPCPSTPCSSRSCFPYTP